MLRCVNAQVWMDVTDVVDYNVGLLNQNNLADSFFFLSRTDPTLGFAFDASTVAGHTYPKTSGTLGKPDTSAASLDRGHCLAKMLVVILFQRFVFYARTPG
jgi:hypothetical protein